MYRVFRVPSAKASEADVVWKDDIVSRQSITAREAKSLGMTGDDRYVLIEGSEPGIARATELLEDIAKALAGAEAERVYRRFRAQDEEAASGMGLIFGP
ncbi:MAG TPA: hypothetical protein VNO76_08600 [Thermoplasmata archaeon]|nr:hypothetical protein [Thermoplasmata archaeon]